MTMNVTDAEFRRAIELIDTGDVDGLRKWLAAHPRLLREIVPVADASSGNYFANPKLLWFIAENPVRNDALPSNISDVTGAIIDAAKQAGVATADLQADMDYTLALVASGRVAREAGVEQALIETLTAAGADAGGAVVAALGHREVAAAECLSNCGAAMTLALASGLGRIDDVERLASSAGQAALQEALALAAVNGEAGSAQALIRHGADPALFNPDHVHPHTTPLHQAVDAGSLATVKALVDGGADIAARDKSVNADALGWARHFGRADIAAYLERL